MKVAMSVVSKNLASLHPELRSLLRDLAEKHIKLLIKIQSKKKIMDRWDNNTDLFPRSTQFQFKLSSNEHMMKTTAFSQLQEDCDKIVFQCKTDLKSNMRKLLAIENECFYTEVQRSLAMIVHHALKCFIFMSDNLPTITDSKIHESTMAMITNHPDL